MKPNLELSLNDLTPELAAEKLFAAATEGRLVQQKWQTTDAQGRHVACMLGSFHAGIDAADKCPGSVMPGWLAEVIPQIFDNLPPDQVRSPVRASRWPSAWPSGRC